MYFLCICLSVFVALRPPICSLLYIKAKRTLFDSFLPQTHWNPPCTSSFPCFILVCSLIKEHKNTRRCTHTSKYNVSRWLPDLILRFLSRVPNAWAKCVLHSQCETTEAAKIPTVWTAPDTICMQFFLRWSWGWVWGESLPRQGKAAITCERDIHVCFTFHGCAGLFVCCTWFTGCFLDNYFYYYVFI